MKFIEEKGIKKKCAWLHCVSKVKIKERRFQVHGNYYKMFFRKKTSGGKESHKTKIVSKEISKVFWKSNEKLIIRKITVLFRHSMAKWYDNKWVIKAC